MTQDEMNNRVDAMTTAVNICNMDPTYDVVTLARDIYMFLSGMDPLLDVSNAADNVIPLKTNFSYEKGKPTA